MKFHDFTKQVLLEGGNVTINDQNADRIDANAREQAVPLIDSGLKAINAAFAQFAGQPLWHPELLASRQFLSGSAFHFFDRNNIRDLDFVKNKPTVGDIDTQVDMEMKDDIIAWLKKLPPGSRLGEAVYVGLKDDPLALGGPQLITLWNFPGIQIETKNANGTVTKRGTNIQIDLELKEFEVSPGTDYRQPTRWSKFSASSSWQDMQSGVKGVFHKYLIMALGRLTEKDVVIRKPVYNRKTKEYDSYKYSEPERAQMFTFAVGSKEGGGLRPTLIPVTDARGRQEQMNGVPVYDVAPRTGYVRDVDQIFKNLFGTRLKSSDYRKVSAQFDSFTGILDVMKKYLSQEERQKVVDKFREKIIGLDDQGRRAQELYKGDPKKDRTEKLTAYNLMTQTLGTTPPPGFDKIVQDYYAGYDKGRGVEEDLIEDDPPDYARKGIQHIYNRLPDGRVSSMEMRDNEFIDLCKEIANNSGRLDNIPISLKVDGAGIRFGRDMGGEPFMMTSRVTQPLYAKDIGFFTRYGQEQGQSQDQLSRTRNYDLALEMIVTGDFMKAVPNDTIVQAEMLFNPMAQAQGDELKFVSIAYDKRRLGDKMTLVPITARQYSTGRSRPDEARIIKKIIAKSSPDIKIVSNKLEHKGIDVNRIIAPVVNMGDTLLGALRSRGTNPEKEQAKNILDTARQQLSDAIITSNKLKGLNTLGDNIEGVVINMPSGRLVKVTSQLMKSNMAAKMTSSQAQFGDTKPRTAVVAIGNFAGHRGHEQLINFAIKKAQELKGTPFVYVGAKVGPDDPIDVETKLQTLKKLFPGVNISTVENQVAADGSVTAGNHFKKIEYELVKKQPFYNNIVIAVGSDQAASMSTWARSQQRRFERFPPLAHVKISVDALPRGSQQGGSDYSTTALRTALKTMPDDQAYQVWSQAYNVDKLGEAWIRHLMDIARKNMGIEKKAPPPAPTAKPSSADSFAREAANRFRANLPESKKTGPKFTGYFKGTDKPPVGKKMVGEIEGSVKPGDIVRTAKMSQRGVVESIEYYAPFGESAVYFRTGDNCLMRTPLSNIVKIF